MRGNVKRLCQINVLFQIATIMSDSASAQVNAQKRRLIAARAIDESEKRMYVQVLSQGKILSNSSVFSKTRRGTPFHGLYGKTPPVMGFSLRLQVYERVPLSLVKVYEREGEICQ